jgi:NAD(P)H-flavin reductase
MRVSLRLRRPLKIRPGEYVYLFFSDMGLRRNFQSHPYVITWWDNSLKAMDLYFLIKPQCGMIAELLARKSVRTVTVDGPYGKNLHLESYETVILVAKGIGIAGILPYVRHMTYRKVSKDQEHAAYRRGLITRKIDIYWVLEENSQEAWVSDFMVELAARDSDKVEAVDLPSLKVC